MDDGAGGGTNRCHTQYGRAGHLSGSPHWLPRPYPLQLRDDPEGAMNQTVTPEKLARLQHLLERQDILDCLIRFSRGMDRFDRELFLSAFHSDAVIAAGEVVGNPG